MTKVSRRERWIVIAGAVVGAVVIVVGWVILPFVDSRRELTEQIAAKQRKLQSYQTFVQKKDEYQSVLEALQAQKGRLQAQILQASDPGVAEARLREVLTQYAQANGVSITRTNILQEEKLKEGYSKIGIDFNVQADIGPLTRFLLALVTNPNVLEIRQVNVNAYMNKNQVVLQPRITLAALLRRG